MELTISQPFPPGKEPTHIEVVALSSLGEVTGRAVVPLGETARLEDDSPNVVRWRYIWDGEGGVSGAWLGEGRPVWEKP